MRGIEYEDVKYKLNLMKKITIIEIKQIQSIFHLGSKKIQQSDSQNVLMTWHCSRNSTNQPAVVHWFQSLIFSGFG